MPWAAPPIRFQNVLGRFADYDAVVFVATSAPYFLVTFERISRAMEARPQGMIILDLSNPRTVDERVATLGGVRLMNLDQIAEIVDRNMKSRQDQVEMAEEIISRGGGVHQGVGEAPRRGAHNQRGVCQRRGLPREGAEEGAPHARGSRIGRGSGYSTT